MHLYKHCNSDIRSTVKQPVTKQNKHSNQECHAFTCLSVPMLTAYSVSAQSVWGYVTR